MDRVGILLANTGTPSAPHVKAVRSYLSEFLRDKHVVQLPTFLWLPLLYGMILPFRPYRSAKLYQKIWTKEGSPLQVIMQKFPSLLQHALANKTNSIIEIVMNYGTPSISQALKNFRQYQIDKLIIFPLYPQFSNVTTRSTFDKVTMETKTWPHSPKIHFIQDYADHPTYIDILARSIQNKWSQEGEPEHLLISFHGIPERYVRAGDPYQLRCQQTVKLLTEKMKFPKEKWTLCFQSRFGNSRWIKPSTQVLLRELPKKGIKQIDVICPGFAVDCLETLEEIALRGKETFLHAGGKSLRYIPALNDSKQHIE